MKQKILILAVCLAMLGTFATAQDSGDGKEKMDKAKAADYSKDHESIDSIIKATYDSISGAKGQKRDWDRFRALFHKDARLVPSQKTPDGKVVASASTPDGYITRSESFLLERGFFEKEVARRTEVFGNIAHVFSTYEGRFSLEDKKPFLRGINSFQLLNDGKRWWVLTIFWLAESPDNPLPEKYLKTKN